MKFEIVIQNRVVKRPDGLKEPMTFSTLQMFDSQMESGIKTFEMQKKKKESFHFFF